MPGKESGRAFPLTLLDALVQNAAAVAAFANCDLCTALDMPCDLFALCLRNALIADYERVEAGRDYLKDAARLMQTEPEFDKIRALPGYTAEAVRKV